MHKGISLYIFWQKAAGVSPWMNASPESRQRRDRGEYIDSKILRVRSRRNIISQNFEGAKRHDHKGVSLYFALIILFALTGALLALITLSVSQIKIIGIQNDSLIAFYAADTGIERVLYEIYKNGYSPVAEECPAFFGTLDNNAKYEVCVSASATTTIQSTGTYQGIQRRIQIDIK
ncbi:pilus assembly PilX N-terminal domain-containing protein [Patescibacteria group bacterium]|nr:pilus assembly PilX N-terminal domain-containing protein [Patescibacteria group bacterium]